MPDPFTAFGTAASAVQLADVALRVSREAYSFLAAIKDAKKDIQTLRNSESNELPSSPLPSFFMIVEAMGSLIRSTALRNTDANVRSLRNYISAFSRSRNAKEDFEVLSETITTAVTNFRDDMDTLRALLPPDISSSLAQKVKCVFDKRIIKSITEKLVEHNAALIVALSITGRYVARSTRSVAVGRET